MTTSRVVISNVKNGVQEGIQNLRLRGTLVSLLLLLAAALPAGAARPRVPLPGDVNGYSLHPPYFNLAESTRISATATCGEERGGSRSPRAVEDLYCKLVGGPVAGGDPNQTIQGQYCDICTSMNSNKAHPITNAIDGTERWWQSPPLSRGLEFNQVNVTLDLGQLFHVAYVLIKFANSPRPDLWVLERSTDFGLTYEPWQYFASSKRDCIEKFGPNTVERITKDDDAICTTEYSRIVPLENGEIVVSLVNGRPGAMNFSYSPLLRNFTKATNIRLRFLQTNTLLGHLMGKALRDPTVTRRYYYSIKDISIGGRCVCHGHADICDAKDPTDPYRLQCDCQHNTCGGSCDRCCPGFNQLPWKPATTDSANECQPCNCNGHAYDCYYDPEVDRHKASKNYDNQYKGGGVCIECQHHTTGINCERCIPGYYKSPDHSIDSPYICCNCDSEFTDGTCEDLTGRCYCKPNYTGELCSACAEGYRDFPHCYRNPWAKSWISSPHSSSWEEGDVSGSRRNVDHVLMICCDSGGRCFCRPEFDGPRCDQCSMGYHSYPRCQACQCSTEGSLHGTCDQETGQCSCRPKVAGLRCDTCMPGAYGFPHCEGTTADPSLSPGSCACRAYVEGPACDRCKPLYWNLTPDNPYGCTSCQCDTKGTISGVAVCQQGNGQCFCKPSICGQLCSTCKDGYFNLDHANYFGCQGCRCDVGGSIGPTCEARTGACHCRQNTQGPTCTLPARDHYFPDLHHLKFELEEGTTLDGRAVRFGYNPLEFENFSWRGYAQMSPIQNKVRITVDVKEAELYLFHVILRYINSGGATVYGKITAYQPRRRGKGTEQTKQIIFAPSTEPAFVTVPQNSFGEPFVLNPSVWSLIVEAEGILLDYLVLLPSSYYEAPILQLKVTEACTYSPAPERANAVYLSVIFSFPTQVEVQLRLTVPQPGRYVLLVEYANKDAVQRASVAMSSLQLATQQGSVTFHTCDYRYEARSEQEAARRVSWSEYGNAPLLHCPVRGQASLFSCFLLCCTNNTDGDCTGRGMCMSTLISSLCSCLLGQAAAVFNSRIQTLGRYAFIVHYYQPNHPTFPVEVLINGGRIWQGQAKAAFCPHGYGCRSVVVSENQIILDVTDNELTVIVRVPAGRQLWLDYILVVPEDSYSSHYLLEEPLDKSYEFISSCGVNSFYINPTTSSKFCRDSAISLSLFYNNGAQPCRCHEAGAVRGQCELFGGQCACKSNVIGRECSRCATGYWGFPSCRPCDCGTRLCDEVTGQCICPPHTIKPECVVCEPQTFGCHALIGCEDCNCSRTGVQELAEPGCDVDSGQCRCKPNIIGRRCDVCASGYYHYPHCRRCDCHQAGTEVSVCDPVTGQCHCKENVEGVRCDQCRLGTFSLDANNPKGCTRCFCFGATDRCHSAEKYRVEVNEGLGFGDVGGPFPSELIHADLKNVPEAYQELYWHAPSSYLGDRVSSYGGYLRYELRSDTRRGDVFIPMESRPDVILKGNQMSIMFLEGTYPSPGEVHEGRLQLVEGNFRHTQTHNPVSREELMMVLANLEQLQIRALFSQLASSVSLRRVVLETVTETSVGIRATNYRGDSCQECAPGYYRDTKGLFLGKCVPCHCNGHSDQCLPGSGICINCQHHTEGDRCERCKDGYVGNVSLDGPLQCMGCPCPLSVASNNFAIGCVHKGSTMQCLCKPGYAGAMCERCAPGYYGNPLVIGSSCQPCDCSENTDPNMLFSDCDSLTGTCTGCMYNTAGPRCEVCAPGYHGDAVGAKNCTSKCGTEPGPAYKCISGANGGVGEGHGAGNGKSAMCWSPASPPGMSLSPPGCVSSCRNEELARLVNAPCGRVLLQEYEKLAARLDGAKYPLTERVKKFSPASSKIPIVEEAEEHARFLDELELCPPSCSLLSLRLVSFPLKDNTTAVIQSAKAAAAAANDTVARVEDTLSNMKKNLDEWKDQYGDLKNEDLNQAVQDAKKSGMERWGLAVKVPLKFNGTSGVQVRTPSDLQDLSAYTSLKFYIQNPEPKPRQRRQDGADAGQFVLYLGNKEVRAAHPSTGAAEGTVQQAELGLGDPEGEQVCDGCQCRALDGVGKSRIRKVLCAAFNSVAKGDQGLLNLEPHNVVFYVGGYPAGFTPPVTLRYPSYRGCIEMDTLNEEVVSLYNFQRTFHLDTAADKPCARYKNSVHYGSYFDGTGYAEIKFESQIGSTKRFEQEIRVVSYNGILFFLEHQAGPPPKFVLCSSLGGSHTLVMMVLWFQTLQSRAGAGNCHLSTPGVAGGMVVVSSSSRGGGGDCDTEQPLLFCRSHFSMDVRLNSASGLLFYVASKLQGSFMALFVSSGRFVFLADFHGNKLRMRSKDKYHDGRWHTVFFGRDGSRAQLVIDGLKAQNGVVAATGDFLAQSPFYVGGAPAAKAKDTSVPSFSGCLKNLKLDGKPLDSPSRVFGVTPCYEGALESGIFFAAEGGYVTLADSVAMGRDLELRLDVRPRSASGLIFHVGTQRNLNSALGAGEFSTSVARPSLCDGQWHSIAGEMATGNQPLTLVGRDFPSCHGALGISDFPLLLSRKVDCGQGCRRSWKELSVQNTRLLPVFGNRWFF
uniref:Laminin subunit alpha 5 n=1 Tax=Chrysemys picta bellii TaxID=8478 RepID=A0A8C3PFP2_CHRPI